jgi:oxalate decarboxylase/phosphoglucose isomerase-like protein (cupin superfamily)
MREPVTSSVPFRHPGDLPRAPVAAGATVYVPQGVWHGLRNNSQDMLGMTAIYAPAGFEQIFKDRLLHPNRTPAEAAAVRKKHGIVYRDGP